MPNAPYRDDETFPAGNVITAQDGDFRTVAASGEHPWRQPGADVRGKVPDNVPAARMHPNGGRLRPGRVRYQYQPIAGLQAVQGLRPPRKDRPINGGTEFLGAWEDAGHLYPW
jgi:hypothetical protein